MSYLPWYYDQTPFGETGRIDGVIHPFANAFFYEIKAFSNDNHPIILKGTINDFDIYVDQLYDIYIWMKQGLVSDCHVEWEG